MVKLCCDPRNSTEDCPNRIREFRQARGLSQAKLGRLAGIHPGDIASFERGRKRVSELNRRRLAAALGVGEYELMMEGADDDSA